MKLIEELHNDTIDANVSLATTLRKAKVLASLLNHQELKSWIDKELNGYSQDDPNIPEYRICYAESFGNFHEVGWGAHRDLKGYHIPKFAVPEHLRSYVESIPITDGVRSLESLLEDKTVEMFRLTWSGDAVAAASLTVYRGFECQTAWRQVSKNGIVHLLDTVRNRLLSFVLELQELYPAIIESEAAIS